MIMISDDNSCTVSYSSFSFDGVGGSFTASADESQDSLNFEEDECVARLEPTKTTTTATKSSTRRKVKFSESIQSYSVPPCTEFTANEISQCWNTPQDAARISAHNRLLVESAWKGQVIDEIKDSLRGLEKQLGGNKPSRRYQESVVIVMETQDEFWFEEDDFKSSEIISSLYRTISRESAAEAELTGLRDAAEARKLVGG